MTLQRCNVIYLARFLGWILEGEFCEVNFSRVNFPGGLLCWKKQKQIPPGIPPKYENRTFVVFFWYFRGILSIPCSWVVGCQVYVVYSSLMFDDIRWYSGGHGDTAKPFEIILQTPPKMATLRSLRIVSSQRPQTTKTTSLPPLYSSLGNGICKRRSQSCPYRRCGVHIEILHQLTFWREFCWVLQVRVASGLDIECPYRVRIVDQSRMYNAGL